MNWEAITAVAEVIGLITIVASLLYLGVQTKQANTHAAASSEIAWVDSLNSIFNAWVNDERTATVIRNGFSSFNELSKSDQALFQMRVGALINQWMLAKKLNAEGLLGEEHVSELKGVVTSILSTDGGMEYWEHDSKITPGGPELLEAVKQARGTQPTFTDLVPWWRND